MSIYSRHSASGLLFDRVISCFIKVKSFDKCRWLPVPSSGRLQGHADEEGLDTCCHGGLEGHGEPPQRRVQSDALGPG